MLTSVTTAEQLARMPQDGNRYELVEGVLNIMSPAGGRHGRVTVRINKLLAIHVDDNRLGATFAAETGFLLATDPDTVRAPDAAFVDQKKMNTLADDLGFLPFAPDLAVEVISPSDTFAEVEKKAFMWLDHGAKLVLIVEPLSETVHAYRSRSNIVVLTAEDVMDATDTVAGWSVQVADFFS
ncbi:MAG: Uma2 family endonuclease [Planctomycetales bacterium]|nr:Uma2 family endonuclease [Planctomycetales bacterium]